MESGLPNPHIILKDKIGNEFILKKKYLFHARMLSQV